MKTISLLFFSLQTSLLTLFAQPTIYCLDLPQTDFENYDRFNRDLKNKKLILLGEMHYKAANYILQADLLIHLNQELGVRHLLIEMGRAEAYLYNRYLQTGDAGYLRPTFAGFNRYEEFFSGMQQLFEYNTTLKDDQQLLVHGLDFEREPGLSAALYSLLSPYTSDPAVRHLRNSIQVRQDTIGVERNTKAYLAELRESIAALSLPEGENRRIIHEILANPSHYPDLEHRDAYMAETFVALDITDAVYFGQFGAGHTMLNNEGNLAGRLNRREEYRDKILVVNMVATESGRSHPFDQVSDCPAFLYRIDPSDPDHGGFSKRGQWALVLTDQPGYD